MISRVLTEAMLISFENQLCLEEKSTLTINKYLHDIRYFMSFAQGKDINKLLLLSYKDALSKDFAVSSANSMIAALNSFFRYLGWIDCCLKQFKIQRKIYCSVNSELTKPEYLRLVAAAEEKGQEQLSLILQTICGTGIRIGELKHITVEAAYAGEAIVTGKNKTRTVFIVRALRKKLIAFAKKLNITSGSIFITKTGNPISRSCVWREMKGLCELAGVTPEKVFPHNLRHLFARIFYGLEKDIAQLADVLGHFSINTTRLYIISTGSEHKRKMELMRLII